MRCRQEPRTVIPPPGEICGLERLINFLQTPGRLGGQEVFASISMISARNLGIAAVVFETRFYKPGKNFRAGAIR